MDLARPSRADNYAMQVASGVDQVLHQLRASAGAKGERPRPFESFMLAFGPPKGSGPITQEDSSGWPKGLRRMTKEDIMRVDQNARRQSIEALAKAKGGVPTNVTGPIPSPRSK